jgi:hypothetical protein
MVRAMTVTNDNTTFPFSVEDRTAIMEVADQALNGATYLTKILEDLKASADKDLTPKRRRMIEEAIRCLARADALCDSLTDEKEVA